MSIISLIEENPVMTHGDSPMKYTRLQERILTKLELTLSNSSEANPLLLGSKSLCNSSFPFIYQNNEIWKLRSCWGHSKPITDLLGYENGINKGRPRDGMMKQTLLRVYHFERQWRYFVLKDQLLSVIFCALNGEKQREVRDFGQVKRILSISFV